ncbi:MAG TPA: ABC transporter ATP-binding protein [Acidimicrobiales bacterium]
MSTGAVAPAAVELDGLTKRFGAFTAVQDVSLFVPAGSLFGVVGPNGAGKTTTFRMCTALLEPDAGRVHVQGVDVWADPVAAKARIGVLPADLDLFDRLTGRQLLQYAGLLRGLPEKTAAERSLQLLEAFDLTADGGKLVIDYSTGMRKKAGLAVALIHSPQVLFLDEPLEAIDPVSQANIVQLLRRYVDGGGTVVLSSHMMEVVERLCDHVAVIDHGRIVATGPTAALTAGTNLTDVFIDAVGGTVRTHAGLEWLAPSSG